MGDNDVTDGLMVTENIKQYRNNKCLVIIFVSVRRNIIINVNC